VKTFDNEGVSTAVRNRVVGINDGFAVIPCREALKFKYGVDADAGSLLAVLELDSGRLVGLRKSVPTHHPQGYAHGCVAEVFNSDEHPYLELELHGPVVTLEPSESFSLQESARLFDMDERPRDAGSISAWLEC
jgi:hypothetical protein